MDNDISRNNFSLNFDISDEDIYEAMRDIPGYLDITPADFKEIYRFAYRHALERITGSIKATDIMTRNVFSVKRATPVQEVAELMAGKSVSGIPVIEEDGKVAGVISEKDFLLHMGAGDKRHFMAIVAESLSGKGCVTMPVRLKKAEDIMTSPAITVMEDARVVEISNIFNEKKINRVPVVGREGELAGIVSRADIVRASSLKTKPKP